MEAPLIKLKDVSKIYKTGSEVTAAVDGISLEINNGEFVAIIGTSGSGKSTLMHILGLLDKSTNGQYFLDGQDVSKISSNKQSRLRNQKIGFVFQQFNLLARTSVFDNVILPTIYGTVKEPKKRALELIAQMGLSEKVKNKSNELSGGQIQRVAIARALMMKPSLLLADEPTGNLDTKRSEEIMDIFEQVNTSGTTVIIITHEPDIAKRAKRVIELRDGKIISDKLNKK